MQVVLSAPHILHVRHVVITDCGEIKMYEIGAASS